MSVKNYLLLVALLVALFTWGYSEAGDDRVYYLNNSDHHRSDAVNESHNGVGYEHRISEQHWFGFMNFDNSFDDNTNVLYYAQETELDSFSFGYQLGVSKGYEDHNSWFMFFIAVPFNTKPVDVGVRFVGVPGVLLADQYYLEW